MAGSGALLRISATAVRALQFLASIVILGIFSYFLAVLSRQGNSIATYIRAVEGISGAAALYTLIAILLTCFLGGVMFFAFAGIVLDICFIGCFIAVTVLTRDALNNCAAANRGLGIATSDTTTSDRNCKLEKAACIVAIILIGLFLISAVLQLLLGRHHQREKRFGPGPSNNYTSGAGKKSYFGRKKQTPLNAPVTTTEKQQPFWRRGGRSTNDTELGTVDTRPSHDTALTGSTVAGAGAAYGVTENKYQHGHGATDHSHKGGHTHPSTLTSGTHGDFNQTTGTTPTNYEAYSQAPEAVSGHHGGYAQPNEYTQQSGTTAGHHGYGQSEGHVRPNDITTTNHVGYVQPQGYGQTAAY